MAGKLLNYEILDTCSPEATMLVVDWQARKGGTSKNIEYPLNDLNVGQCLVFRFDGQPREISELSLRAAFCQKAKKLGIKVTIVKHTRLRLFEVARIA